MGERERPHYVSGRHASFIPPDWAEYRAIMPRLAQRFTVVARDLPGIGRSAPVSGGYDAHLAAHTYELAEFLKLDHGHDLGGLVTHAMSAGSRLGGGAMVLDVPIADLAEVPGGRARLVRLAGC